MKIRHQPLETARFLTAAICILISMVATSSGAPSSGGESAAVVDCDSFASGVLIGTRFSSISVWDYLGTTPDESMFHESAEAMPEGWLRKTYPWLREIEVFAASGGSYIGYQRKPGDVADCEFNRDLFKNPSDRAVLDDYDFAPLVRACRNILRQGLKPCLKLHAVPLKYSRSPKIEWFRVNNRPPDNYAVYADYISALVQSMVKAFGMQEVRHWRWIVGTEIENRKWWEAEDGSSESSLREFLKFYDWSVFAVDRVLGPGAGPIGSHAMMAGGLWNPDRFFEHCRFGVNAATHKIGTRLDFFAISVYDRGVAPLGRAKTVPTNPGGGGAVRSSLESSWRPGNQAVMKNVGGGEISVFEPKVARTRAALAKYGFGNIPIEVGEGGILFGSDGKWLWYGLCPGGSYDASWTALSFRKMLDSGVSRWSRWPLLRTDGLFHGIETAGTHSLRLIARMSGDKRLAISDESGLSANLGLVASMSADRTIVRVLAYHHAGDMTKPDGLRTLRLDLKHLPFEGAVELTIWRVDREHGDFWPQWERDREAAGIGDDDFIHSRDQVDVAHALKSSKEIAFWKSKQPEYKALATVPSPTTEFQTVHANALNFSCQLPCFAVALVEIRKLK